MSHTSPLLIAIDDKKFYLDEIGYEIQGKGIEYKYFEGPSAFEEEAEAVDVNRANLILIDYDFVRSTAIDRDLPGYIRHKFPRFKGKIALISVLNDFLQDNQTVRERFDAVIDKRILSWNQIQALMA